MNIRDKLKGYKVFTMIECEAGVKKKENNYFLGQFLNMQFFLTKEQK